MAVHPAQSAIIGVARVGIARVGACVHGLLCQIGRRTLPARVGVARIGASRVGATVLNSNLRLMLRDTFMISDSGYTEPPTCQFAIVSEFALRPQIGEIVIIAVGTLRRRLFGGNLGVMTEELYAHGATRYRYNCQAFGFLKKLQHLVVFAQFSAQLAGDILRTLFAEYAPLYDVSAIGDGLLIDSAAYDGISLLEVCNDLAIRSQSLFYVDALRRVRFEPHQSQNAPWVVTPDIVSDLSITADSAEMKNQVIVRYSLPERRQQQFVGDNITKEFPLFGEVTAIHSLTVDHVPVTYDARYRVDNSKNDFSVYYGSPAYIATSNHAVLQAGQVLDVTYTSLFPARVMVTDRAATMQQECTEGGDGLYMHILTDRTLQSTLMAVTQAREYLRAYALPEISAAYCRHDALGAYFTRQLRVGQRQRLVARGHDVWLTIQQLQFQLDAPRTGGLDQGILLSVTLGSRQYSLADLFKAIEPPSEVKINEYVSTRIV